MKIKMIDDIMAFLPCGDPISLIAHLLELKLLAQHQPLIAFLGILIVIYLNIN